MNIGVIIEKGLKDWQIVQQVDGKGNIELFGSWNYPDKLTEPSVWVRIVKEDSGQSIHQWKKSHLLQDNKWEITLEDIPVGGLYRIETCLHSGNNKVFEWDIRGDMIHHFGVGDIYVIAGQSNAAGYGKDHIYDPPELGIHLYKNSGKWDIASHPFNESTNTIHPVNREGCNPGHSPFLNFGRQLKKELNYPIGFIQASLGGSPLSRWCIDEDGDLYKSMIESIHSQGGKISGVLWYQGCTDAMEGLSLTYYKRFKNMVFNLRKDLKDDNLPILTVQLNRHIAPTSLEDDKNWSMLREVQRQLSNDIFNIYTIPSLDCTLSDMIHNSAASNMVIGERLAKIALSNIYNIGYKINSPNLISAILIDFNKIELKFENVINRIYCFDCCAEDLSLNIDDDLGKINILSYEQKCSDSLTLVIDRNIEGLGKISCGYGKNPKGIIPIDFETHMPILSFYNVDIIK